MYLFRSLLLLLLAPPLTIVVSIAAMIDSFVFGRPAGKIMVHPRFWGRMICRIAGVRVRIEGLDNINPETTYLFVANHVSQFDIFSFQAYFPYDFRWIAKKELFLVPFFGSAMRRAGFISIDRSRGRQAMQSLIEAARLIREGASVLIFPEGTRSPDGTLQAFKSGAATLALKAGVPVVPLAFVGSAKVLPKGRLLARPGTITIRVGRPIAVENMGREEKKALLDRLHGEVAALIDRAS